MNLNHARLPIPPQRPSGETLHDGKLRPFDQGPSGKMFPRLRDLPVGRGRDCPTTALSSVPREARVDLISPAVNPAAHALGLFESL